VNSGRSRTFRALTSVVAVALMTAGLIGIVEVAPASALGPPPAPVVPDQGLSAVGSPIWQTNNSVEALGVANGVVYAGGAFTSVRPPGAALGTSETARNHLAAFSASTGALVTSFNPNVNGEVYALNVSTDGTKLYVAGNFTTVGGTTRQRIARLNLPSGTVDTAWTANANAIVATVTSNASSVYVGGDFTNIKNTARQRVAKLNTTNGDVVTAFNASSDKRIAASAIAPDGSRVLIGGENDVINGQPQAAIASLNPTTGALMPWAATGIVPRPANGGCTGQTSDIIVQGTTAYVTASSVEPGCWEGYYAANISDGSLIYNEACLGGSVSLAIVNGWMYRGSHNHDCAKNPNGYVGPNNANNFVWNRLETHQLSTGRLGHWTPKMNGGSPNTATTVGPLVMATDGTQLFVGGDESDLNGTGQEGLARFGPTGVNSTPDVPTAPRVTPTAAGTLSISAEGVSDNNNGVLTYALYRDGGSTPIATTSDESWPWSKPVLRFIDSGLTAGTSHTYQLTASDGTATSVRGPASLPVTVGWQNPPTYPAAVSTVGSTVHWQLDGATSPLADSSGNGNTGTIVGGVTTGQPGAELGNAAIATDGSTGYVTSSAPIAPTAAFTQSVWFNTTTERGGAIMGFSNTQTGVTGTNENRAIWMDDDGKVVFGIRAGRGTNPGTTFSRSLGTYNDGKWHQAVGVYNGTNNISLYLDGQLVGTTAVTQTQVLAPTAGYLRVGYMDLTSFYTVFGTNFAHTPAVMSYFWQGSIDEATLHPTALTADQVAALYASGSAHGAPLPAEQPQPPPPPPPPPPSAYPTTVLADAPTSYWHLGEAAGTLPMADASGNNHSGTYRSGLSFGATGALTGGSDTAVSSPGSSGIAYTNQQQAGPTVYSLEAWVKTSSFNGGKIIGLENVQTGWGTTYDRQLYMTNNGRIAYGILSAGVQQTVITTASYNNNVFHHVVATQGAGGMALYVDGVLVGTNATVTPDAATGYWRIGGGNLTGWPSAPSSSALIGTFDEIAVYPTALSAARVAAHFAAASS
jgi:hypothetical protein